MGCPLADAIESGDERSTAAAVPRAVKGLAAAKKGG